MADLDDLLRELRKQTKLLEEIRDTLSYIDSNTAG